MNTCFFVCVYDDDGAVRRDRCDDEAGGIANNTRAIVPHKYGIMNNYLFHIWNDCRSAIRDTGCTCFVAMIFVVRFLRVFIPFIFLLLLLMSERISALSTRAHKM